MRRGSDARTSTCDGARLSYDFYVKQSSLSKANLIRQSLKLGLPVLRARLGKRPQRRLSLVEHFKRMKGLELPPYLDE